MGNALGELCTITKGLTGIQKAIAGEYPLVVTAEERKTHNEYQFDDEAVIVPLVSGTGHGHASINRIHYQTGKFALGSILCAIIPKDKSILNGEYLFRFLNLNKDNELVARMRGMANVTLPIREIAKIEIPLPSLPEQIKFIEKYELLEEDSQSIELEFTTQLSLVKQLRQAFLSEAMQGKLCQSEPVEDPETGQQLLARIKAEKAQLIKDKKLKKEKELPPIKPEEIPFEIPKDWVWCRLGEIKKEFLSGNAFKSERYSKTPTKNYVIRLGNVKNDIVEEENKAAYIDDDYSNQSLKYMLSKDDLLITMTGTRGKKDYLFTALVNEKKNKKLFLNQRVGCLRFNGINVEYVSRLLKLQPILEPIFESSTGAANQANIGVEAINNTIVPFPPLSTQNQIVAKLNELMKTCDDLENSIKQSQLQNERLLQQVLKEALEVKEGAAV